MATHARTEQIWYDGELVPWHEATTHVLTHTLHYGLGVFEGIRAYHTAQGPAIFRLQDHIDRLFRSAHILGMTIPFNAEEIYQAHRTVVRSNAFNSCYLRPMAFYGSSKLSLTPPLDDVHVIVAAWPWGGAYLGEDSLEKGIRVKISSFTRHHVNSIMCKAKANGNYINSILANTEATRDGYDEALLLDTEGYIAEGAAENIFFIRKGTLFTPEPTSALDGITRDCVLHLAKEMQLPVIKKRITRDEAYCADEAFFTGTAAEITPICELDHRKIGQGVRGPLTTEIQRRFFDCVKGIDTQHRSWLTFV